MDETTTRYVEKLGSVFNEWNLPQIAGQVFGLLLLTTGAGLTATDLAQRLSASSGSISTMTGLLVRAGALDRLRPPGERQYRYRVVDDFLIHSTEHKLHAAANMYNLMEEGSKIAPDRHSRERLHEMADFYQFFEQEASQIMERWKQSRLILQSSTNKEAE